MAQPKKVKECVVRAVNPSVASGLLLVKKLKEKRYMKFYFTYILLSLKDKKFYIGFTNSIKRRLLEHNAGLNKSTIKRRPLKLIFFEAFLNKKDAIRREKYFKTSKGKTTIKQMTREYLKIN
jgi:putative endonuclease